MFQFSFLWWEKLVQALIHITFLQSGAQPSAMHVIENYRYELSAHSVYATCGMAERNRSLHSAHVSVQTKACADRPGMCG